MAPAIMFICLYVSAPPNQSLRLRVSLRSIPVVTRYIAMRDEHHKKHSFQEEFLAFLKKNNVACDERYIWD